MITAKPIDFNKDMSQILDLTKNHLDESFSDDFFIWKHLENPFGKSFAMGAWDDDKLVGLRMFMRWEFIGFNQETIKAIRPVDTVTHKEYRGKGIFKDLTLRGLDIAKNEYNLIFNTPNQNSLPGYLKMGWNKINIQQPFIYAIVNPFKKKLNSIIFSKELNNFQFYKQLGKTNVDANYLKWRYKEKSFLFANYNNQALVVYKLSKFKGIKTIMIYEVIGESNVISKMLSAIVRKEKTIVVYGIFNNNTSQLNFSMIFKRNIPVVVWRDDSKNINDKLSFSLGDLEGKL